MLVGSIFAIALDTPSWKISVPVGLVCIYCGIYNSTHRKAKMFTKITEGEGYIGGDMECWCINPFPLSEMKEVLGEGYENWDEYEKLLDQRVYPSNFVPDELEEFDETPRVKYKVTFEAEIVGSSTSTVEEGKQ